MAVETCAEKQARLTELDAAILRIATGGHVVLIKSGEKTLQYSAGNLNLLRDMRNSLADEVAACTGNLVGGRRRLIYLTPVG